MKGRWLCLALALPAHSLSRVERFAVSVGSVGPEETAEASASELAEVLLKLPSAHEAQLVEVTQKGAQERAASYVLIYAIIFICVPLCTCAALLLLFADGQGNSGPAAYASARESKGSEPRVISFTKPGSKPLGLRGSAQSLLDPEESGSGRPTLQPMIASRDRDATKSDTALLIPMAVLPFHQDATVVINSVSRTSSSEFFAKFVFSEDAYASGVLVYDGVRNQVGSLDTSKAVGPQGEPKKSERSVTLYQILESGLPGEPLAIVARVGESILVKQHSRDIFKFTIDDTWRLNETILGPQGRIATFERSVAGPSLLHIANGQDALMVLMATIAALKLL